MSTQSVSQPFVLVPLPEGTTGLHYTDTHLLACGGCEATISDNAMEHRDDCGWMAAVAAAERHNIVKWLYAEANELAHGKPGLTAEQRHTREENSQALITAIAHMAAHGMDGST